MKKIKFNKSCFKYFTILNKNLIYIKPNYTLDDLKYKEEIFEYFSIKYLQMNDEEVINIMEKLKTYKILSSELKDIKLFLRDFLEKNFDTTNVSLIINFIKFVTHIYPFIEEHTDFDNLASGFENTHHDRNFYNIMESILDFMIKKKIYIKSNKELLGVFKYFDSFPFIKNDSNDKEWTDLILQYKNNEETGYRFILDFSSTTQLLLICLNAYRNSLLKNEDVVKYLLNNFYLKLLSIRGKLSKDNNSVKYTEDELLNLQEIFLILEEILSDKNRSKLIYKEANLIKDNFSEIFKQNKVDIPTPRICNNEDESKVESNTINKSDEISKMILQIKNKYI